MHYKDGTPAQLGDLVKGTGYNVPHEIQGVVIGLTPGASSCNLRIAHVVPVTLYSGSLAPVHSFRQHDAAERVYVGLDTEYGQCDAFELVHRKG